MNHIRRTATTLSAMLATLVGLLAGAPAAFAVRVAPPGGPSAPAQPAASGGGMAYWQVGLVALAAALVAATITALAMRIRLRAHPRAATA